MTTQMQRATNCWVPITVLNTTHTPKAQGARQESGKKNHNSQRPNHLLQDSASYPGTYVTHVYELEDIIIAKLPQMTLS